VIKAKNDLVGCAASSGKAALIATFSSTVYVQFHFLCIHLYFTKKAANNNVSIITIIIIIKRF